MMPSHCGREMEAFKAGYLCTVCRELQPYPSDAIEPRELPSEGEQPPTRCEEFATDGEGMEQQCALLVSDHPRRQFHRSISGLQWPIAAATPRASVAPTATEQETCVIASGGDDDPNLRCTTHSVTFSRRGLVPTTCDSTRWITPERWQREQAFVSAPPEAGGVETTPTDTERLDWWFANGLDDSVCEGSVDLWWATEKNGDATTVVTHGTSLRDALDKAMQGIHDEDTE